MDERGNKWVSEGMNEWVREGMNGAPKALSRSFPYTLPDKHAWSKKGSLVFFWDQPARIMWGGRRLGSKRFWKEEVVQKLLDLGRVGEPQPASVAAERGKGQGTWRDVSESAAP